jgi:CRP-like cAMP-binding protein
MAVLNPMTRLPALRPVPIFRGLSKASLFAVARQSIEVSLPAGATVVTEGDPGDALCVIVEGKVDVRKGDRVVAELEAGDYFGELSLIDGEPRTATVVATTNLTLLTLSSSAFDTLLTDPYFARAVLKNLAQRFRQVQDAHVATDQ